MDALAAQADDAAHPKYAKRKAPAGRLAGVLHLSYLSWPWVAHADLLLIVFSCTPMCVLGPRSCKLGMMVLCKQAPVTRPRILEE